jgi:hypothetical protein
MIIDTIIDLQNRGFTFDFSIIGDHLFCVQTKCFINSDQFDIVEIHIFDHEISGNKQTVLYAIEWFANAMKGILLENSYKNPEMLLTKVKKFWK